MEPALHKGDILFVRKKENEEYRRGDIIVFSVNGTTVPYVHRVISEREHEDKILTIPDNNVDGLMVLHVNKSTIHGSVVASIPYLGLITILADSYPVIKYTILLFLSLSVITEKRT